MNQRQANTFAHRLWTARRATGLSQQQVADHLGMKRPAYANWESGTSSPRAGDLFKVADFFRLTPAYLQFGESGPKTANTFDAALQSIRAGRWTPSEANALKAMIDVQVV